VFSSPFTHIWSISNSHTVRGKPGRVTQLPPNGYVTPGSSRSNSSSSLYPGPVYGFVPSPLVPSPPRSQTSDDAPAKPASQKTAWQVGVSSSASGSSTCTSLSSRPFRNLRLIDYPYRCPQTDQNHRPRGLRPVPLGSTCTHSSPTHGSTTLPSHTTSRSPHPHAPSSIAQCTRPSQPSHSPSPRRNRRSRRARGSSCARRSYPGWSSSGRSAPRLPKAATRARPRRRWR